MSVKTCSKCQVEKKHSDFHNSKRTFDGKDSYCKLCRYEYGKKYNELNRERVRAQNRERRRKNMEGKKRMFGEFGRKGHSRIDESLPSFKDIPTKYMLEEMKKESGYIYLIEDKTFTHYVKIGQSVRPNERIQRLAGQMPIDVEFEMIYTKETDDVNRKERVLHMFFADKRKKGEWFELDEGDIELVKKYMNDEVQLGWIS